MAHCLWNDFKGHRKLHLANWRLVYMKKEFEGLGIPSLQELNLCLLGSWIKRYSEREGQILKTIIDHKYRTNKPNIFTCATTNTSRFWKWVMSVVKAIKFGYRWLVGNGQKIRFSKDTWFGTSPLVVQLQPMYVICNEASKTIREICDDHQVKLTFRRNF